MTKLPTLTGKALIAALAKGGFEVIRIKGSHTTYGIQTADPQ